MGGSLLLTRSTSPISILRMAQGSLMGPLVLAILSLAFEGTLASPPSHDTSAVFSTEGNAFNQFGSFIQMKHPSLPYVPVKYLKGCRSVSPDFGPHPDEGALKGLGQHLQVAMEVSCTNFFMRCAYAKKDFGLLAEAIAGGLLDATSLMHDQGLLVQGITVGASKVYQ